MSAKLEFGSLEMAMTQFRRNLELALRKAVFSQSSIDQLHFVICIITILLAVCTSDLLLLVVSFASAITTNRYPINTCWILVPCTTSTTVVDLLILGRFALAIYM